MTRFAIGGCAFILAALTQTTSAQTTSKPGSMGNTAPGGSPSGLGGNRQTSLPNPITGTVFISGRVMLEDGTPPPEPVLIERICGSVRRAEAHTDQKGRFSFQVGAGATNTEQLTDISADSGRMSGAVPAVNPGGMGGGSGLGGTRLNTPADLRGCEIHAVLPGYQSRNVNISTQSSGDNPDVGAIILKRLAGRDGDTISVTNALAPNSAKRAFDKARALLAKGEVPNARIQLTKAVAIYPKYAAAWLELGRLQMDSNQSEEARASFNKSLAADPRYLPPYERLAVLEMHDRNWQQLADTTDRLIQLNAYDYPQAFYFNALAHLNLNQPGPAEKSARESLKLDPLKFARARYILGLAIAQRGDFQPAIDLLKAYLATSPPISDVVLIKDQLVEMEKQMSRQNPASAARK
jgi:tetratricopeptide (TPR) repeat protein